ncbi:MAG: 2-oxo acid dehydrogenase subunit E2, partial [Lentisphaerae bacterium]
QFDGQTIYQYDAVHLAFAVDTPRGLLVPVIRHANTLSLREISRTAKQLSEEARSGRINPDLLQGGTFTITNLGAFGIEQFTPVLNLPQVAILGIGNAVLRPVEEAGEIRYRRFFELSLTINHQVVDGAPAARFLQQLAGILGDIEVYLAAEN